MRKVIVTTGALITQGGAESTHCEVLPFPEGRLSGRDAHSGYGRSARSSCLVSETLTAQERDIRPMIGQGLTSKRIGRAREISPETVKSHVKRIFQNSTSAALAPGRISSRIAWLLRGGSRRKRYLSVRNVRFGGHSRRFRDVRRSSLQSMGLNNFGQSVNNGRMLNQPALSMVALSWEAGLGAAIWRDENAADSALPWSL